jgi:hypothetical protein
MVGKQLVPAFLGLCGEGNIKLQTVTNSVEQQMKC